MQLQHLHTVGVMPEVPVGAPYAVGLLDDWGFYDYGYGPYALITAVNFAQVQTQHPLELSLIHI